MTGSMPSKVLFAFALMTQATKTSGQGPPPPPPPPPPTAAPTTSPTSQPSSQPSVIPSNMPSSIPSTQPSNQPSVIPSNMPSSIPSKQPSNQPSVIPSLMPSSIPSKQPSNQPSVIPSNMPSSIPSKQPSTQPSAIPSTQPSSQPSESPSANPSQGCDNIRTDCGWGIFNPWTCRCDCPAGICLDDNEQCYTPCQETIDTNPFAGCSPGWDCPWFPDHESGFCKSMLHQPNEFEIYRTAKECCDEHYGGSTDCMTKAKTVGEGHAPFPWPIHFPGTSEHRPHRPYEAENWWGTEAGNGSPDHLHRYSNKWFPDLVNKQNCVYGANYEDFMSEEDAFRDEYLFTTSENCCQKWYPHLGANCPESGGAVNGEAEDEAWLSNPYSQSNYYYPDFSQNSCGFGRDYPSWMGINGYEKHYLFMDSVDCCDRYFKNSGTACPFESTVQNDYYWTAYETNLANTAAMPIITNRTYWPLIESGTCVDGTDYPDWMGFDDEFSRLYLFKSLEGCCNKWFQDWGYQDCINNVVSGYYKKTYCPENRPVLSQDGTGCQEVTNYWSASYYPDLDGYTCKNDGDSPSWMSLADYKDYYIFTTKEACCSAFGYTSTC